MLTKLGTLAKQDPGLSVNEYKAAIDHTHAKILAVYEHSCTEAERALLEMLRSTWSLTSMWT